MQIYIRRVYEEPVEADGYRVLVDRVWPRGKRKEDVRINRWMKSVAPSSELRKWFNHDPEKWERFKELYLAELHEHEGELRELLADAGDGPLTLLYSARDEQHNNAVVLREVLERLRKQ